MAKPLDRLCRMCGNAYTQALWHCPKCKAHHSESPKWAEQEIKFCWWPVDLYEYRRPYWYPTGKKAWLRRVRVVRHIVFGYVTHTELKEIPA